MRLWLVWWSVIEPLREVCARQASFLWLAMTTAGICARGDLLGVSSIVRTLGLAGRCYDRLLDFFHSPAVDPDRLSRKWTQQAMGLFPAYRYAGRPVLLGDGIKIPKSGRKMPAVKLLYQESEGNTKPRYIMGHSVQVVSMLVAAAGSFSPCRSRAGSIGGQIYQPRPPNAAGEVRLAPGRHLDRRAVLSRGRCRVRLQSLARRLVDSGNHLISRLPRSAVAYAPAPPCDGPRKRGRPRLYGPKIKLWSLFDCPPKTGSPRPAPSMVSAGSRSSSCAAICSGDRCAA